MPVNLLYTTNGFFIGAGPNFSYGLSGKIEFPDDEELDVYDQEEADVFLTLKRFEVGANCLMGYTFPNGLILQAPALRPALPIVFTKAPRRTAKKIRLLISSHSVFL